MVERHLEFGESINDERLVGNGYGFPLKDLVPYLKNSDVRTPHNVFFYALGYTGWIGVILFFWLQASVCGLLWRVYKLTGRSYGLAVWACVLIGAFFGNSFETPVGAISYYIIMGLLIGGALCGNNGLAYNSMSARMKAETQINQPAYARLRNPISIP